MATKPKVYTPISIPDCWEEKYSESDIEMAIEIIGWCNDTETKTNALARIARVNQSTLYRCLNGIYNSPPTEMLNKALAAIRTQNSRSNIRDIPFIETSVTKQVFATCSRARHYRGIGCVTGWVGVGKTTALKEYQKRNENTVMIEADPGMLVTTLIDDLVKACGCSVNHSANQATKYRAVIDSLTGTDTLIIIDEAETLTPKALEYIRRIRDKAKVGVVFSGTEKLRDLIAREHGQFDQIRSRVNSWMPTAKAIKRDDAEVIIHEGFADLEEIPASVIERIWQYSAGSIRVLAEDLIPAIRDYGDLENNEFSPALVDSIAVQVLGMAKVI